MVFAPICGFVSTHAYRCIWGREPTAGAIYEVCQCMRCAGAAAHVSIRFCILGDARWQGAYSVFMLFHHMQSKSTSCSFCWVQYKGDG